MLPSSSPSHEAAAVPQFSFNLSLLQHHTPLAPQIAAPSCGEDHSRALDEVHVRTFPWWSGELNPGLNYLRRAPSASCLRSLREGCTNKSGRAPVGLVLPRGSSINRMTSSGVFQPFLLGALSSAHFIFKAPFEHCLPDASNTLLLLSLLPGTAFDFSPKELRGQGEGGLDGQLQHTAPSPQRAVQPAGPNLLWDTHCPPATTSSTAGLWGFCCCHPSTSCSSPWEAAGTRNQPDFAHAGQKLP